MCDRLELPSAFKAGMVFAFNTDLFDPKWRIGETGALFLSHHGDYADRTAQLARLFTAVITGTGAHSLHKLSQYLPRVAEKSSFCRQDQEN